MCLIAVQPAGDEVLPEEYVRNAWSGNPDGAGYMFQRGGEVVIRKAFFKLQSLLRHYKKDFGRYGQGSPFVLHFRWKTHGPKTVANTHPHEVVPGKVALAHNGIVDVPIDDKELSDTVHLCRLIRGGDPEDYLRPEYLARLEEFVGRANKLVIMTGATYAIVNEEEGVYEKGGRWFSNEGYRWEPLYTRLTGYSSRVWTKKRSNAWSWEDRPNVWSWEDRPKRDVELCERVWGDRELTEEEENEESLAHWERYLQDESRYQEER